MKKVIVFLICLIGIITSWYFIERFSYSKEYIYFDTPNIEVDSILTIGIIGDSWVSRQALDSLLGCYMQEKGVNCNVISSGHPGARTKRIYQNLFENEDDIYSSKFIIETQPDYCVIIAGVNDAASQIGAKNYSYHTRQIIRTLLHYKIKPVVVSLPEFGIVEFTNKSGFPRRFRSIVSACFNNNNEIDNIATYRNVLNDELISAGLIDSVVVVNFDNICDDYSQHLNLYGNASHLSQEGNQKLAKEISNIIKNDIMDGLGNVVDL